MMMGFKPESRVWLCRGNGRSAFFRRIQDVCLYRIEHKDTIRAACSDREDEGLGRIPRITDSQVDAAVGLGRRFYRREEKFRHKVKRHFFHKVGVYLEANLSLSDPHGEVLSIPQQDETHPSMQSVNAKENGHIIACKGAHNC